MILKKKSVVFLVEDKNLFEHIAKNASKNKRSFSAEVLIMLYDYDKLLKSKGDGSNGLEGEFDIERYYKALQGEIRD